MRSFFKERIIKARGRSLFYIAGILIIFLSGSIVISSILVFRFPEPVSWTYSFPLVILSLLGALMGVLIIIFARQETRAIDLFDWLQELNSNLAVLSAPLNVDNLRPACKMLLSAFPKNAGWIMLVRAPGLLIRGEVKRRKYLIIVSDYVDRDWNINLVENYLKDRIESADGSRENIEAEKAMISKPSDRSWSADLADSVLVARMKAEGKPIGGIARRRLFRKKDTDDFPMLIWTSHLRSGDISTGMAIALRKRKSQPDTITMQALSTGLYMVAQRIGSILMEVIQRREGLGIENLGLIMRVLAHEINNDLQGALNTMDTIDFQDPRFSGVPLVKLQSLLARAGHWSHLMREAPFLVDDVLPVERKVVSLLHSLREMIDESRQAWPDLSFILQMPEGIETLNVIGDQHIRSVFRNLLHNAASFSPEEGIVEISVAEDGKYAHVFVHDEGPGVDPADMDRIFSPLASYKEGRRAGERADYGMGVGLTLSRAISRAYGGGLLCHSNTEEEGGCFEVYLPLTFED
ncbi:MAG: sensor histidine kinase [Anaerolineales bacterium]